MTRDPDTKLIRKFPLGPSPAGLGLQVSVSPSCLETKGRILQRMWDGKAQENLTRALHKVVHFYRIKEKPKADSDPGLGSQCQETLASPWGRCTISSHQAIGGGGGVGGCLPNLDPGGGNLESPKKEPVHFPSQCRPISLASKLSFHIRIKGWPNHGTQPFPSFFSPVKVKDGWVL